MTFYVASGVANCSRVNEAAAALAANGHYRTYDWTTHGSVKDTSDAFKRMVAASEAGGVAGAELVVLLLPGGKGTHTALPLPAPAGAASSSGRKTLPRSTAAESSVCSIIIHAWNGSYVRFRSCCRCCPLSEPQQQHPNRHQQKRNDHRDKPLRRKTDQHQNACEDTADAAQAFFIAPPSPAGAFLPSRPQPKHVIPPPSLFYFYAGLRPNVQHAATKFLIV